MRRRTRLAAIVAALFALQAPLCAVACIGAADAAASLPDPAPCHGDDSSAPPADAPQSHDDCGCHSANDVLVEQPDDVRPLVPHGAFPAPSYALPIAAHRGEAVFVSRQTDLPPPDILLLKSTLLI